VLNGLLNKLKALASENEITIREQIFNILSQIETLIITNQPGQIPVVKFVNGKEEVILPGMLLNGSLKYFLYHYINNILCYSIIYFREFPWQVHSVSDPFETCLGFNDS